MSRSTFPVLGGGDIKSVPWDLVEPHRKRAMENHYQTLERLAERGGLGPAELFAVVEDRPWRSVTEDDIARAPEWLEELLDK